MKLADLLTADADYDRRFAGMAIGALASDSRKVTPGTLFVAVPGTKADGLAFVGKAIAAGAAAVMAETQPPALPDDVAFVRVPNVRRALSRRGSEVLPAPAGDHRRRHRDRRQDLGGAFHAANLGAAGISARPISAPSE